MLLLTAIPVGQAATWHVRIDGNDGAAGTNWGTAKQTIQAAVDLTTDGDTVLVSNGVYATGCRVSPGYVSSNRVVITRNILVQSVNGPDVTSIRGENDGLYSVTGSLRCAYLSSGMLAGFALTNGATPNVGDTTYDMSGGGALVIGGALSNCVITRCAAYRFGGGVVSDSTLTDCTLTYNQALYGGGAGGGTLTGCTLSYNQAAIGGGATMSTLRRCTLNGNSADYSGGGAKDSSSQNCTFYSNSAIDGGGMNGGTAANCWFSANGAQHGGGSYKGELWNCTLVQNTASVQGGGSYKDTLFNCIVYHNHCTQYGENYYDSLFSCSCSTPAPGGQGNLDSDPQFKNHLFGNFRLQPTSPCINRGDNAVEWITATDLDGNPRVMYGTVDMGAYEYQLPTGYWQWSGAITNGLTNTTQCAAGDGYPNLLKYAAGGSPTNADHAARLTGAILTNQFAVQFNRNRNAYDTTIIVEGTDALSNAAWHPLAVNFNGAWGGAGNVTESGAENPVAVTVTDTAPSSNRFLRVRVTLP